MTDTPNFLRVAQALSKFKDPYKAADMLLSLLASQVEQEKEEQP